MNADKLTVLSIMKENALHAYLATTDGDQPRVRPVSPIVQDDMSIWITTFASSRKVAHIRENPRVCLAFVEQPRGDKAATVIGKAELVEDPEEKQRVWGLAAFNLLEYFPEGPASEDFCLLRISIDRIEWRDGWASGMKVYKPTRNGKGRENSR